MFRSIATLFVLLFVFGMVAFPAMPVAASQGITLTAAQSASSAEGGVGVYGLTILVQWGIMAAMLLVIMRQSGTVKDLIPVEVVKAIVDTVVDVTRQTPTPLDDQVAERILKPLVERILAEQAPVVFQDLPTLPPDEPPGVG